MRHFLLSTLILISGAATSIYAQQPINDEPCGAITLPVNVGLFCPDPLPFSTVNATYSASPVQACGSNMGSDVWFKFTAPATTISVTWRQPAQSTIYGTIAEVYRSTDGTCNNMVNVGCNTIPYVNTLTNLTVGSIYYIRIGATAYTEDPGFTSAIGVGSPAPQPVNDECANAISLNDGQLHGLWTDNATQSEPPSDCGWGLSANGALDAWYKVTPATSGPIVIKGYDYTGTGVGQPYANLEQFSSCGDVYPMACDDDDFKGYLEIDVDGVAGNTYYFRMYGRDKTGYMAIQAMGNLPLPVGVNRLNAALNNRGQAELTWNAGNGDELLGFGVERMDATGVFINVGFIPVNREERSNAYVFTDNEQLTDRTFYRLREEHIDGSGSYSNVVSLAPQRSEQSTLTCYPNPATDYLHIALPASWPQVCNVSIMNSLGQMTTVIPEHGSIYTGKLAPGIYQLVISGPGMEPLHARFVKK